MQQSENQQSNLDELKVLERLAEYQAKTEKNRLKSDGCVTTFIACCFIGLAVAVFNVANIFYIDTIKQEYTQDERQ